MRIAKIYSAFIVMALIAGVVFIVLGGLWKDLGIPLVVGSLFSLGAFIAQFWSIVVGEEDRIDDAIWRDARVRELARMVQRPVELEEKLSRL
jgi:hypothetical protein